MILKICYNNLQKYIRGITLVTNIWKETIMNIDSIINKTTQFEHYDSSKMILIKSNDYHLSGYFNPVTELFNMVLSIKNTTVDLLEDSTQEELFSSIRSYKLF